MRTRTTITCLLTALVALAAPRTLLATDGYFVHGWGTAQKGMAGAGVSMLFSPSDTANNPAAGVFTGAGVQFGVAAFSPERQFDVTGTPSGQPGTIALKPGTVISDQNWFPVPQFAIGWKLGQSAAFGVNVYGNSRTNTTYNEAVYGGSSPTGVNSWQMFVAPNISAAFAGGSQSLGASAVIAYQRFEAKGLERFETYSDEPGKVTNNGPADSYGVGVRVGYIANLSYVTIGAAYQSRIRMSKFQNYSGLLAEQGGYDIPSNWVTGFSVRPVNGLDIAVDVQRVKYSEVKSMGNPMLPNLQPASLGDTEGAGFGWKDQTTVKIGAQMHLTPGLFVRGGYSHGDQPIPESEMVFNILWPAVVDQHISAGFTKAFGSRGALHFAVTRALSHSVTGPNALEAPGRQQITLSMNQWDVEVGYSIRFGR
jgi:long-chain fatty acid transport protein